MNFFCGGHLGGGGTEFEGELLPCPGVLYADIMVTRGRK